MRYGFEKDALKTNKGMMFKYQQEILDNIDEYDRKIE